MLLAMKTRMLSFQMGNGQGNGNENVKKRFKKQNNNFASVAPFLVHFFAVRARPPREISLCDLLWGCPAYATFFFSFSSSTRVRSLGIQHWGNSPTFDILSESEKTFMQLRLKKPNPFQQPCYHSKTRMSTLRNQLRVTQLLIFGAAADQKARSASLTAF